MSRIATMIPMTLLALLLLAVTNPSPDRHKQAIRDEISRREPIASAIGIGFLSSAAASYHSLLIGSYMSLNGKTISVGALTFVWVDYDALDL